MECDIILNIGGDESTKIEKESSSKELDSLSDIVDYINNNYSESDRKSLIRKLQKSSSLKSSEKTWKNKPIIGNSNIEYVRYLYPQIEEILNELPKDTLETLSPDIALIDQGYTAGKNLKGRVANHGNITHIIKDLWDAITFAKTIVAQHRIDKFIIGDNITNTEHPKLEEIWKNKYLEKLQKLKKHYSKDIKKRLLEFNPNFNDDITINHLLNDYLYNKSSYSEIIDGIDSTSLISDFIRELQYLPLYNEDSETPVARRFRSLNYKREEFGKSDFLETILQIGTQEQIDILKQFLGGDSLSNLQIQEKFVELDIDTLTDLYNELFKNDPIMSRYRVVNVDKTVESNQYLSKKQIKKLIDQRNTLKGTKVKEEELNSIKGIKEFFEEDFTITIDNVTYALQLEEEKGKIKYFYKTKLLDNKKTIKLERMFKKLSDEFSVGYDTLYLFSPVNDGEIVNGLYKGMYIYEYTPKDTTYYFVSKSIIHPDLFNLARFTSLKDAKDYAFNLSTSEIIEDAANIQIKQFIQQTELKKRSIVLSHPVTKGQAISSKYYPLEDIKLKSQEYKLFTEKSKLFIQDFYKNNYNIDLSLLDTAEEIGIFLYAMTQENFTIEELEKGITEEMRNKISEIINAIYNAPIVQYEVEQWGDVKNHADKRLVYLRSLRGEKINSTGFSAKGKTPTEISKNGNLYALQKNLNEGLFKDSGVKVEIISKQQAQNLKNNDEPLFTVESELDSVRAFVHNNTVYIISNNSDAVDMIHETFHILLGSLKANNFILYEKVLNHFYNKISNEAKELINTRYENFAYIDQKEEAVVRYLAKSVTNGNSFFEVSEATEIDQLIFESFSSIQRLINKSKKNEFNVDKSFEFKSAFKELNSALGTMQKNRIVTNVIRTGISNGSIIEDCL